MWTNRSGHRNSNGCYFLRTLWLGTAGLRSQRCYLEGLTTQLKTTGTAPWRSLFLRCRSNSNRFLKMVSMWNLVSTTKLSFYKWSSTGKLVKRRFWLKRKTLVFWRWNLTSKFKNWRQRLSMFLEIWIWILRLQKRLFLMLKKKIPEI